MVLCVDEGVGCVLLFDYVVVFCCVVLEVYVVSCCVLEEMVWVGYVWGVLFFVFMEFLDNEMCDVVIDV